MEKVKSNPYLENLSNRAGDAGHCSVCFHPAPPSPVLRPDTVQNHRQRSAFPEPLRKHYAELNRCQCWFCKLTVCGRKDHDPCIQGPAWCLKQYSYFWSGQLTCRSLGQQPSQTQLPGSHVSTRRASVQVLAGGARECAVAGTYLCVSS